MQLSHSISNKPFVKVVVIVGLIILGFWIASFFPDLVLTLIISTLSAFILKPLVRFLEFRFGLKRWFASAVVFLFVGGMAVFILVETIPLLINRIRCAQIPGFADSLLRRKHFNKLAQFRRQKSPA